MPHYCDLIMMLKCCLIVHCNYVLCNESELIRYTGNDDFVITIVIDMPAQKLVYRDCISILVACRLQWMHHLIGRPVLFLKFTIFN